MNKVSLISMAMSFLFCSYLNASEQPVSSDVPATNSDSTEPKSEPATATESTQSAPVAEESKVQEKRQKAFKKRKCKKRFGCKKSHKKGDEFTEQLNKCGSVPSAESSEKNSAEKSKCDKVGSETTKPVEQKSPVTTTEVKSDTNTEAK